MRLVRSFSRRAQLGAILYLTAAGCDQREQNAKLEPSAMITELDSLRGAAIGAVLGKNRTQWVSRFEMCLVPEDASSILECKPRAGRVLSPLVAKMLGARAISDPNSKAAIQCLAISRAISLDTMVEVRISQVGADVVDGLAESSVSVVRFVRAGAGKWSDPTVQTESAGDVSPVRSQDECSASTRR
jgi:hypothetical protein